jgi:hypothetical protein
LPNQDYPAGLVSERVIKTAADRNEGRRRSAVQRIGGHTVLRSGLARSSAAIPLAGLALALLASPPAHAQNLINDGSFEDTQLSSASYDYVGGTLNDWLYSGYAVLINVAQGSPWIDPTQMTGYDGNQVAGVQLTGSISQVFAATTTGPLDVTWLDNARPGNTQNYTVSLTNNGTGAVVASETLTVTSGPTFTPESLAATLVAGANYTLTFQGVDTAVSPGADETALIDNIDVGGAPAPVIGGLPLMLSVPFFAAFAWLYRRRVRAEA